MEVDIIFYYLINILKYYFLLYKGGAFGTCIAFVASCKPNNDVILYSIE